MAISTKSIAAFSGTAPLGPHVIKRRAPTANDVAIDIKFAGICHSDIHTVKEEWGPKQFPLVVGHEIGGYVSAVGENVTRFKVGDIVGVGCMVDSCRSCRNCRRGEEQYCSEGMVGTYGSLKRYAHMPEDPEPFTHGGYSQLIVVNQDFVVNIPANLDLAAATPLLCAGITTYSPLIHFGLRPSHKLAVVGLGGLGHMAVKFGKAFGAHVTVISRGPGKRESALNELHADDFLDSTDAAALKGAANRFDFILNSVSAPHDVNALLATLDLDGTMCFVGAPPTPHPIGAFGLIGGRRSICGSLIGGVRETQEMLEFCGRHNIVCDIEKIPGSAINEAYDRTLRSDVKYRFVIDISTL